MQTIMNCFPVPPSPLVKSWIRQCIRESYPHRSGSSLASHALHRYIWGQPTEFNVRINARLTPNRSPMHEPFSSCDPARRVNHYVVYFGIYIRCCFNIVRPLWSNIWMNIWGMWYVNRLLTASMSQLPWLLGRLTEKHEIFVWKNFLERVSQLTKKHKFVIPHTCFRQLGLFYQVSKIR